MIGRTNVGGLGGGGSDWSSAIIHVYAPAGTIVTATKGIITKVAIEHPVIGQNSEYFIYIAPEDFGAWSVNAVLPSSTTKSETITVSSNIMYFVEFRDALLPEEYQQVEYIQSSGTQYIDTNRPLHLGDEIELSAELTDIYGVARILGQDNPPVGFYTNGGSVFCEFSGETPTGIDADTGKHTYNVSITSDGINSSISYDTSLLKTATIIPTGTSPIYLCHSGYNGQFAKAKMKIYSYTVNNSGISVAELVPCYLKSDHTVIGMYDTGAETLLTNAGTGSFTVGPDVN